jgi:hypothetical protein
MPSYSYTIQCLQEYSSTVSCFDPLKSQQCVELVGCPDAGAALHIITYQRTLGQAFHKNKFDVTWMFDVSCLCAEKLKMR